MPFEIRFLEIRFWRRRDFVKGVLASGGALVCKSRVGLGAMPPSGVVSVKRVLVIFMCHLDVGFTDTQAGVMNEYFDQYFPEAIHLAATMRQSGGDRYIWTTGSWLLYEYLDQAAGKQRKRAEQAVEASDLAWHALPFNWQTEMLDRSMVEGALALSHLLDRRFGRVTAGAKMSDVPGHTRGLVGPLAANRREAARHRRKRSQHCSRGSAALCLAGAIRRFYRYYVSPRLWRCHAGPRFGSRGGGRGAER